MNGFIDNELTLNLKQCHPEVNMASTTKPAVGDSDGLKQFVTGFCDTIGLNPDYFEPHLSNPAPKGR